MSENWKEETDARLTRLEAHAKKTNEVIKDMFAEICKIQGVPPDAMNLITEILTKRGE